MTPKPKSKFVFYEVVTLRKANQVPAELVGREAAILGMASDNDGNWFYSVTIEGRESCIYLSEEALESTGRFKRREDFYSGESIKVSVNPETGKGEIIQPPEE